MPLRPEMLPISSLVKGPSTRGTSLGVSRWCRSHGRSLVGWVVDLRLTHLLLLEAGLHSKLLRLLLLTFLLLCALGLLALLAAALHLLPIALFRTGSHVEAARELFAALRWAELQSWARYILAADRKPTADSDGSGSGSGSMRATLEDRLFRATSGQSVDVHIE